MGGDDGAAAAGAAAAGGDGDGGQRRQGATATAGSGGRRRRRPFSHAAQVVDGGTEDRRERACRGDDEAAGRGGPGGDAATGIRGLPHALGARRGGVLAVVVLLAGTAVSVLGPLGPVPGWAWGVLVATGLLAVGSVGRGGRTPFRAAMLIALANVVVLLARAG